jgi:hypothetical protein
MDFGDVTARHRLAVCVSWIALLLSGRFAAAALFPTIVFSSEVAAGSR